MFTIHYYSDSDYPNLVHLGLNISTVSASRMIEIATNGQPAIYLCGEDSANRIMSHPNFQLPGNLFLLIFTTDLTQQIQAGLFDGRVVDIIPNTDDLKGLKKSVTIAQRIAGYLIDHQRNKWMLDKINSIGISLSKEKDIQHLLDLILNLALEITNSDSGTLYFLENQHKNREHKEMLRFLHARNLSINIPFENMVMELSKQSLAGYCALTGETLNIEDVYQIPEHAPYQFNKNFDIQTSYRSKSMLIIPLINSSEVTIGVLQLINKKKPESGKLTHADLVEELVLPYSDFDIQLTRSFGSQATISYENHLLIQNLSLQLINNRKAQEEKLNSLVSLVNGIATEVSNPINFITNSIVPLQQDIADIYEMVVSPDKSRFGDKLDEELTITTREIMELMQGIKTGATQIHEIVRSLRPYSLLSINEVQDVPLGNAIELARQSVEKDLDIRVNCTNHMEFELKALANAECLHVIFMEIFTFISELDAGKNIEITLDHQVMGNSIVLLIEDQLPKLSDELAAQVFKPFYNVSGLHPEKPKMGLSIASNLLQKLNGELTLNMIEGTGNTYQLLLPSAN